jgi:hypothetical protein
LGRFSPGDPLPLAKRAVLGNEKPIFLLIEGNRLHTAERLVVDIGNAGIHLEIFEQAQDRDRRAGQDRETDAVSPGKGS